MGKVLDDGTVEERAFRLVGREGGPRSEMLLGWRTPIPASQSGAGDSGDDGVTSYVYQNVGVSANLVRLLFVLSCLLPGPQVLIYIALWVIMPRP